MRTGIKRFAQGAATGYAVGGVTLLVSVAPEFDETWWRGQPVREQAIDVAAMTFAAVLWPKFLYDLLKDM